MSKYNNKKTIINNILFDSKREGEYYEELCFMQQDHSDEGVKSFILQPKFLLQEAFNKDGTHYRPIYYIADFDVIYNSGKREIIDVKSDFTKKMSVFRLKQRLFDYKFPNLTLVIVT